MISEYGGLAEADADLRDLFLIMALSSMGLPPLNGFIGEFSILRAPSNRNPGLGGFFAARGIVLGAAYLLWLYQRVFFGDRSTIRRTTALLGPERPRAR